MRCYTKSEVREFIRHYLIAALWSSHDYRSDEDSDRYDTDAGENMDYSFDPEDIDPRCVVNVRADAFSFIRQCVERGIDLRAIGGNEEWSALAQHGHDFWLTRCGHGVGFWDRGYGEVGERLSDIARNMGSRDCIPLNDDTFGIE
jgi:hypothetical protein